MAADPAPVLVLIDVQEAFGHDRAAGYPWGNPDAEAAIAALLAGFRAAGLAVIHVHHHGTDPGDDFHPDAPGCAPMQVALPQPGETVVIKHRSSAFVGTDLADRLKALGNPPLVIAGGAANYCVESTVRMAGDLGHAVSIAGDALINMQKTLRGGRVMAARDVLEMTLANLGGEFARVTDTATLLTEIAQ